MKRLLLILLAPVMLMSCQPAAVSHGRNTYKRYFSKVLKDPESFMVYDESVEPIDDHSACWTLDYGAKNSYGAMERRTVTFKTTGDLIDIDGRLVDVGDL